MMGTLSSLSLYGVTLESVFCIGKDESSANIDRKLWRTSNVNHPRERVAHTKQKAWLRSYRSCFQRFAQCQVREISNCVSKTLMSSSGAGRLRRSSKEAVGTLEHSTLRIYMLLAEFSAWIVETGLQHHHLRTNTINILHRHNWTILKAPEAWPWFNKTSNIAFAWS